MARRKGDGLEVDSGADSALYKPLQAAAKRGRLRALKLLDLEAGDQAEVAEIDG